MFFYDVYFMKFNCCFDIIKEFNYYKYPGKESTELTNLTLNI